MEIPGSIKTDMVSRFMWAVHTGPSHPDATAEKAVETIVAPLLRCHQESVELLRELDLYASATPLYVNSPLAERVRVFLKTEGS